MSTNRFLVGVTLLALAVGFAATTHAQSPGTADYRSQQVTGDGSLADPAVQPAAFRPRRPCPPGWVETTPSETPTAAAPQARPGAAAPMEDAIPPGALASAYGAAAGPASTAPTMIGDSLNNGGFSGFKFFGSFSGDLTSVQGATVALAGGNRRFKISEIESPVPVDRVFFEYNHFQNPILDISGNKHNLERFTFGAEKTFRDGLWSLEMRVPFSSDYNATQTVGGSLSGSEFGDMNLVFKRLLIQRERFALSAGINFVFPTGPDWKIVDAGGTAVEVWNESVHINPFIGALFTPTDRLFFLFFGQMDFDTRGDTVLMRNGSDGPLVIADPANPRFHEQTLGFLDLSVGYRLYKNPCARIVTGVTPIAELHYTSTLTNMDLVTGPQGSIGAGNPETGAVGTGRRDILDLTGGVQLNMGPLSCLTMAGVFPLSTGNNRQFDSEFIVQFERRF